ncbi:hypothetical protein [Halopseudomonas sp.]|uniref:hypothetical protein n=1 Tax=Halopseudomonas sp. TaxID=2901191 RepID=UPI0039E243E3
MIWGLFIGIVILIGLLFARRRHKRDLGRKSLEARLRALTQLRLLRLLLEQVQRHRGLCFGVLCGDQTLEGERWLVHAEVSRLIGDAKKLRANLLGHEAWQRVFPLWQRIDQERQDGEAIGLLNLHNELAELILGTIEALADRHDLVCLGWLAPQPEGLWLALLQNAEVLGQARAAGTGIAARRQDDAVQQQVLKRLADLIRQQFYLAPAQLSVDPALRASLARPVREAEDSIDALLQSIDLLLKDPLHPALGSMAFFKRATQAISAHYMLADLLLERLRLATEAAIKQD